MSILPEARAYLIRIQTHQQQPLLAYRRNGQLCLNAYGTVVAEEWIRSASSRKGLELDLWTVLPNGIQGIVILNKAALPLSSRSLAGETTGQKPWVLSSFIASFKAAAAKRINLRRNQLGEPVWQRSYQEQLSELRNISQQISELRAVMEQNRQDLDLRLDQSRQELKAEVERWDEQFFQS